MVAYHYDFRIALVKGSPNTVAANATVLVYDPVDTGYVTPVTVYSDPALTTIVNLVTDAHGVVPDFWTDNKPDLLWKSGAYSGGWATTSSRPGARGKDGAPGAPGATGAPGVPGLNGAGTNADVAAYIPASGPTRDALDALFPRTVAVDAKFNDRPPVFKAATAYTAGQRVIAPNGDVVSAKIAFTSGATYAAADWNASTQDGRLATAESNGVAAFKNLGTPANGTDINTIQATGHYPIPTSTAANTMLNLPVLYPGTLEVFAPSSAVGYQRYTTFGDITNNALSGSWIRLRQSSTTWNRWWKVGEAYLNGNLPATAANPINLDTFKTAGVFTVNNTTTISYTTGLPSQNPGVFENLITYGAALSMQRFTVYGTNVASFWRVSSNVSGGWHPWQKVPTQADIDAAVAAQSAASPTAIQHTVRDNDMRRRRFNKVTAPGVAVLIMDHGLTNFKATVWPLLQARALPVTVGINPGQMTQAQNSGATYADVASWADTGLIEPANHSYNHVGGSTSAEFDTEIRASRVELETQLGRTIDTWVHPGNVFGDFTVTADPNLYWNTEAGRLILANHGAVTGLLESSTLPLGMNTIGAAGAWIDNDGSTAGVQNAISAAVTKQGIQIVRLHPQFLNDAGKLTTAELTSFLDWLKAEQDAGRVKVLTFRDAMSATR